MKITAKTNFAGLTFSATSGQVLDLPDDVAKDLIRAEYAEEVKDEDKRDNAGDDPKPTTGRKRSAK